MIGRNIKRALERQGKTQRELAEDIGITEASMSRYIHGDRVPKATMLVKIANALGVTPDQLLSDKDNPYVEKLQSAQPDVPDINVGNCPYCHEDSDGFVFPIEKNGHAYVWHDVDGWVISLKAKGWRGSCHIKFCPMCGRRLKHE